MQQWGRLERHGFTVEIVLKVDSCLESFFQVGSRYHECILIGLEIVDMRNVDDEK